MRYHNITTNDMLNGNGLRVVLWVAGCTHRCEGCQNPITWDEKDGVLFDDKARAELYCELDKDWINGITFSGGDPLHPANKASIRLLSSDIRLHYPSKTQWLYTGYTWEEIESNRELREAISQMDVVVEGRFIKNLSDINYPWAGSTNQRVIDVKKSLFKKEPILWKP